MCDAATHDAVHDTVHDAPSLEYRCPTLRNGGFIAEEYSKPVFLELIVSHWEYKLGKNVNFQLESSNNHTTLQEASNNYYHFGRLGAYKEKKHLFRCSSYNKLVYSVTWSVN